ncbi:pentatricopeptide repeat-containing protein [Hibiscus syriacus]|uniref:Pentatricopeptide repeat-containing protein n=1 Tax=Hibiscus syriacus TaxID=106335 RepID=A0A6A3C1N6_HIBSY|nr:pentatricopeptide repeat-containing protein [Hibiscus syriacus]
MANPDPSASEITSQTSPSQSDFQISVFKFSKQQRKNHLWCEHCKKPGHMIDQCWKLHGKPADWQHTRSRFQKEPHIASQDDSSSSFSKKQIEELQQILSSMTAKPTNVTYITTDGNNPYASSVQWIIDSGASDHMTGNINILEEYSESSLPASIKIADGSLTTVKGSGSVTLNKNLLLHNVLYVPRLACNLLSVSKLIKDFGCNVVFGTGGCIFQTQGSKRVIGSARLGKGLYTLGERKNRHLLEVTRSLMFAANAPKYLWGEALLTATYLINRMPRTEIQGESYKEFQPVQTDISLQPISYKEFQPVQTDISLQPILSLPITVSPKPASTVPVPRESDGNNLNNSDELPSSLSQHSMFTQEEGKRFSEEISQPSICKEPDSNPVAAETEGNDGYQEATTVDLDDFPIAIRKGVRKCTAHPINKYVAYGKLQYNFRAFTASINTVKIPRNVTEAFQSPEWKKAVEEEIKALQKNKTWSLTDLPKGKRAVGCRWIFTVKYHSDGSVERYKARLVAKGFSQSYGIDYQETSAPVAKLNTIRILLSVAVTMDWKLHQLDIKNAFLNGNLEEESPRAWFDRFAKAMTQNDDMIITGSDIEEIEKLKMNLAKEFETKDLGSMRYFLGMEVARSEEGLVINQRKYVLDLLAETGMLDCKPVETPMEPGLKFCKERTGNPVNKESYQRLVGKLIYLSLTRPDIAYSVSIVSQHMSDPREEHLEAVNRILRFLKFTPGAGLIFRKNQDRTVKVYTDASWGGELTDRRSVSGYCTYVWGNLVTWRSKKQTVVSRSSAESEFKAMALGICEGMWIKRLLTELDLDDKKNFEIFSDSQSAMSIAKNPVQHDRTKHIEIDRHFIYEKVNNGVAKLQYIPTKKQLTDIFTKALPRVTFDEMSFKLGRIVRRDCELSVFTCKPIVSVKCKTLTKSSSASSDDDEKSSPFFSTLTSSSMLQKKWRELVRERESVKSEVPGDNLREVHGGIIWSAFVDNLSRRVSRSDLWARFSHFGKVIKVFIPFINNRPKYKVSTFAFVHFASKEDLCNAVDKMNNVLIDGRRILVAVAKYEKISGSKRQKDGRVDGVNSAGISGGMGRRLPSQADRVRRMVMLDKFHDGRSYKEAVVGVYKEPEGVQEGIHFNSKELNNTKDVSIPVEDRVWLRSSLTGIFKDIFELHVVQKALRNEGINVKVVRWGFSKNACLVVFQSVEEKNLAMEGKWEALSFWFERLEPVLDEESIPRAFCTISMIGVPLNCWSVPFFTRVVSRWGKLVKIKDETAQRVDCRVAQMLLRVVSPFDIPDHTSGFVESPAIGSSGGMLSCWDDNFFEIDDQFIHRRFIAVFGKIKSNHLRCGFINVYGPSVEEEKAAFFDELELFLNGFSIPLCVGGDFNAYLNEEEKLGRGHNRNSLEIFNHFIQQTGLIDLPLVGGNFTWSSYRDLLTVVRLDRFLVNCNFSAEFSGINQFLLPKSISDHNAIFLERGVDNWGKRPFRLFNYLLSEDGFEKMVVESIKMFKEENSRAGILSMLRNTKSAIKCWSGDRNQFPRMDISMLEDKIHQIEKGMQHHPPSNDVVISTELRLLRNELWRLLRIEEQIWVQKSREKWVKGGDRNSKFFHTCASIRRRLNSLYALNVDGVITKDPGLIKSRVREHFFKAFNCCSTMEVEGINLDFAKISPQQNLLLEKEFTEDEIWGTINSCDSNKAPGPDGLNMGFFKNFWLSLKGDILKFFHNFYLSKEWEHGINHSSLTLIPKGSNVGSLDDFRPISLVGGMYKILSKCLARRLRCCINVIISESQFAFIPGRQILDCSFIANEGIDLWRKRGLKGCVFKVDFKKAYDSVDWDILFKVMAKMGFGSKWCSWIRMCVSTASVSVLVNGVPTDEFPMARGLRQGCSLSPLLFNLVGELLNLLLRKAVSSGLFSGLVVGKDEDSVNLSHLQFADDLIIFCSASKTQIVNVKRILREELLQWANAIGCPVGHFPAEYLGLPLGAKRNSMMLWDPVVQKFHSKLAGWKAKTLSMAGRLVLLKAVLGSLPIYFMSLFKMPSSVSVKLNSIMARFLWGGGVEARKIHWVNWTKVCSDKSVGGLGAMNISLMNRALLGRWSWRFANDKDSVWKKVICCKYNLDPSLLLFNEKLPTHASWIWKSVVLNHFKNDQFGAKFRSNFKVRVGDGGSIRFWLDSWAHDSPLKVIFPRLYVLSINKYGKLYEFGEFRSSVWSWHVNLRRNLSEWELVQYSDLMTLIHNIPLSQELSDGLVWYGNGEGVYTVSSSVKSCRPVGITDPFWKKYVWRGSVPPRVEVFLWQVVHQRLPVKVELQRKGVSTIVDVACPFCGEADETSAHLFFSCSVVWSLWNKFLIFWGVSSVFQDNAHSFMVAWDELVDQIDLFFLARCRLAAWFLAYYKVVSIPKDSLICDPSLGDCCSLLSSPIIKTVSWSKPPEGFIKLNVDAAVTADSRKSGVGGILRVHDGSMVGSFQEAAGPGPPVLLELKAIMKGLSFFDSFQQRFKERLIVESDSKLAVDWVKNIDRCPYVYLDIVTAIVGKVSGLNSSIRWVARSANVEADSLAKAGIG